MKCPSNSPERRTSTNLNILRETSDFASFWLRYTSFWDPNYSNFRCVINEKYGGNFCCSIRTMTTIDLKPRGLNNKTTTLGSNSNTKVYQKGIIFILCTSIIPPRIIPMGRLFQTPFTTMYYLYMLRHGFQSTIRICVGPTVH